MDFLTKCKDTAAANYATLAKAGLFKLDNFKAFTMELSFPFVMFMEQKTVAYVQSILLAQTTDLNVSAAARNSAAPLLLPSSCAPPSCSNAAAART